jgi:hypothetical protein
VDGCAPQLGKLIPTEIPADHSAMDLREECRGHLWRGRFASFAMEERYIPAAVTSSRYDVGRSALPVNLR